MRHGVAALALLVSILAAPAALAEGMSGNVQFFLGQRFMEDFWEPLDEPSNFGVEVDFAPSESPVRVALAMHFAHDEGNALTPFFGDVGNVEAGFFELSAGFLWHPVKQAVARPYLGAGIVKMYGAIGDSWEFFDSSNGDDSFGFYGNLGIFFKVGTGFNIGVDGRIVRGTDLQLVGVDTDADYEQASILVGFSWGGP